MFLSLYALLLRTLGIDLHAKNQHNIWKGIEKKSGKLFHQWNLQSIRHVIPRKINEVQQNSNSILSHYDWLICQKSAQYLQAFRKKLQKTVWSLKFTKSKVRDFTKNRWSVTRTVSHGGWLTCQKSGQYLQAFRKKVRETVWSLNCTRSKAQNFAKNRWSKKELKLNL